MKTVFISQNQEIFNGAPVITGTRIPAVRLKALIDHGYNEKNIKEEFPQLSMKKIRGALTELIDSGIEHFEHAK